MTVDGGQVGDGWCGYDGMVGMDGQGMDGRVGSIRRGDDKYSAQTKA